MYRFALVCFFSVVLTGCQVGQLTTLYNDDTSIEENGLRVDANHKPITGIYQKHSKKMRLLEESQYVNGKLNGLSKIYSDKGKLILTSQYHKGKLNGKQVSYYNNGKEYEVSTYIKDQLEGGQITYDPQGNILRKGSYQNG